MKTKATDITLSAIKKGSLTPGKTFKVSDPERDVHSPLVKITNKGKFKVTGRSDADMTVAQLAISQNAG